MKLSYDPFEKSDQKWDASTDDGDYDASGITPIDAIAGLCEVLEQVIK